MILAALMLGAVVGLPDPALTPGEADPALTKEVICDPNWSTRTAKRYEVRNVPEALKRRVYQIYHMRKYEGACAGAGCEVDHLISLQLGGSNSLSNLWPQPYGGIQWNAHVKDKLENRLHRLVCNGTISLKEAQDAISKDWIAAYRKYMK